MTQTKARHGRGAHLLLLTALLLYIGSMAVEPVLHAAASGVASADAVLDDGDEESTPGSADHECSVCKLTRVFSAPMAAAAPALEAATLISAPIPADLPIRGPPALASSQPRAPPLA